MFLYQYDTKPMNSTITQEDILRYIYKDTSPQEHTIIEEAINKDRALKLFYLESLNTLKHLDKVTISPSPTSISIILDEAAQSSHLETS